ncbi:hypothetical protein NYE69_33240 [Paenibacillus sp. FSL R5-0527]|uniref:hypothetical protein n=1 Tax=Paenibacillus sp. FSL R5-0527 TaxID=2975321 RepID=UPI00097AFA05|nr:hypothetical protein BK140_32465 [Paenibacillus macerans]
MTKQVRDWQKDKRYLDQLNDWEIDPDDDDLYKTASYWHREAAAEKERADKAEQRARVTDAMEATARAAGAALIEAEAREKKLREAIEQAIKEYGEWNDKSAAANVMVEILMHAIEPSYYPVEEEEAK